LYEVSVQWNKLNLLSKSIYICEQVSIGSQRTGAYYTAKLTFSHGSSVKVWGAYYTSLHMIFKFLRYSIMVYNHFPHTHTHSPIFYFS